MLIPSKELEQERHLPCYQICHQTAMNAYKWNTSRVTVREGNKSILSQELSILSHLSHPQLLLMMGQTEAEDLRIVFEPVMIGSLFQCLHQFHMKIPIGDTCLQVTEALMYLRDQDLVHSSVSSHAIQMITPKLAKLGMFERSVLEGEDIFPTPPSLYNWTSPEILMNQKNPDLYAMKENDVYSLCCVMWEMCTEKIPWSKYQPNEIVHLVSKGYTLKLDRERLPRLLFRVMRQGLIWNVDERDLELAEVRDMLLMSRDSVERKRETYRLSQENLNPHDMTFVESTEANHNGLKRYAVSQSSSNSFETVRAFQLTNQKYFCNEKSQLPPQRKSALHLFAPSAVQSDIYKLSKTEIPLRGFQGIDISENEQQDLVSISDSEYSKCTDEETKNSKVPSNNCYDKHLSSKGAQKDYSTQFLNKYESLSDVNAALASANVNKDLSEKRFGFMNNKYVRTTKFQPLKSRRNTDIDVNQKNGNINYRRKFNETRKFFEDKSLEEEKLNVSSGELYKTALTSPNSSLNSGQCQLPVNRTLSDDRHKYKGTYMDLWSNKKRSDEKNKVSDQIDDKVVVGSREAISVETTQNVGFVKNVIKFYQNLEVDSDITLYQSANANDDKIPTEVQDKSIQTDAQVSATARFQRESTPINNSFSRFVQTPPSMSPLYCSPLFQNKKKQLQNQPIEESFSSFSSPAVDFTNPDQRQSMFTTALAQIISASPDSVECYSPSSKDVASSPYRTCLDFTDTDGNFDQNKDEMEQKKQAVVTFNSSVEEITTSIVSLATDSFARETAESSDNFDTVQDDGESYFDDDLNSEDKEEPINMQLLHAGDDENINWEEDVNYLPDNENEFNESLEEVWKLGDRCLAQSPNNPGSWYPANITMIMEHEVAVTFEHNPDLKSIPKNCLRRIGEKDKTTSEYETVVDQGDTGINFDDNKVTQSESPETHIPPDDVILDQVNECVDNVVTGDENGSNEVGFETGLEPEWKAGDNCVAKWDEDGCWYKAVIEGIEDDTAVVTFTEYGNSAYCNLVNILDFNTQIDEEGQLKLNPVETNDVDDDWS